jgi:hypothetical protein
MKKYLIGISTCILITACSVKNDTAVITVNEKDGLVNRDGTVQIKPIYKKIYKFTEIERNTYSHLNYVNFHWLHMGEEQYAVVKNIDNKYGIISKDGRLKLKVIYDSISNFFNGYAKVEIDGKFGLIDENFNVVVKPIYDDIRNTINSATIVRNYEKNNRSKYGCLDSKFKLVAPIDYDMIYLSSEERMRTERNGLWGFLDKDCKIVSKTQYKYANDFFNGMAKVQKKDKLWTYINLDGEEIKRKTFNGGFNF